MTTMPPGWYDDGHGALRWWDGAQWTEHVAMPDAEEPPGVVPVEAPIEAYQERTEALGVTAGGAFSGYPGAYSPPTYSGSEGGAFVSATEPGRSKTWIVWLVLGVVLLGAVIALSVLVPLAYLDLAGPEEPAPGPATEVVEMSPADEQAATAAVEQFNDAYTTEDCDAFFAATTESMRAELEIADCDAFAETADYWNTWYLGFESTVTSVEGSADSASVFATETYTSVLDEEGNETEDEQAYEDNVEYTVIPVDDGWAVDSFVYF